MTIFKHRSVLEVVEGEERKMCRLCNGMKPIKDFKRDKRNPNGAASVCMNCTRSESMTARIEYYKHYADSDEVKECSDCHENKLYKDFDPRRTYCNQCQRKRATESKIRHRKMTGISYESVNRGGSLKKYLTHLAAMVKNRANRKDMECTIDAAYLMDLFSRQSGLCALTGTSMTYIVGAGKQTTNLSIDRIDSHKGYTPENTHLVCYVVNVMKSDWSVADFLEVCEKVCDYNAKDKGE